MTSSRSDGARPDAAPAASALGYRFTPAHFAALAGIVGGTLAILGSFGRRWWCECGSLVPWSADINGSHNSQHFVDPYSVSHFEHGLFFFVALLVLRDRAFGGRLSLSWRLVAAAGLECLWEILENSSFIIDRYRAATISLDYYGDAMLNSLSDVIFASLGFVITSLLPGAELPRGVSRPRFWAWWWGIVLVCELGLIFTVRDSLAINVVMLIHPIEAIRAWQSGG